MNGDKAEAQQEECGKGMKRGGQVEAMGSRDTRNVHKQRRSKTNLLGTSHVQYLLSLGR